MNFGRRRRIGLLGGSFDPVHVAHLALGQAAMAALKLNQMVLIPTGHAWQKGGHQTEARHRLAMLRLAIAALPANTEAGHWLIDEQELNRQGPSYTIDTLRTLRRQYGQDAALILVLGSDQFRNLETWREWRHLLDYAHLAVTQREQVPLADLPPDIEKLLMAHGTGALPDAPCGSIMFFRMPPVPLSSTQLRRQLAAGQPVNGLLPMGVEAYIRRHGLYGTGSGSGSGSGSGHDDDPDRPMGWGPSR